MKLVKNKEKRDNHYLSVFEMNLAYQGSCAKLLNACVNQMPIEISKIEVNGGHVYTKDEFIASQQVEAIQDWCVYGNEMIITCTDRCQVEVKFTNEKLFINKLMMDLEKATYHYHSYPQDLICQMMERFQLNMMMTLLALDKLQTHPNLYHEFTNCFTSNSMIDQVEVEGYKASQLISMKNFSLLDAYLCMVQLMNDPQQAKEDLMKEIKVK